MPSSTATIASENRDDAPFPLWPSGLLPHLAEVGAWQAYGAIKAAFAMYGEYYKCSVDDVMTPPGMPEKKCSAGAPILASEKKVSSPASGSASVANDEAKNNDEEHDINKNLSDADSVVDGTNVGDEAQFEGSSAFIYPETAFAAKDWSGGWEAARSEFFEKNVAPGASSEVVGTSVDAEVPIKPHRTNDGPGSSTKVVETNSGPEARTDMPGKNVAPPSPIEVVSTSVTPEARTDMLVKKNKEMAQNHGPGPIVHDDSGNFADEQPQAWEKVFDSDRKIQISTPVAPVDSFDESYLLDRSLCDQFVGANAWYALTAESKEFLDEMHPPVIARKHDPEIVPVLPSEAFIGKPAKIPCPFPDPAKTKHFWIETSFPNWWVNLYHPGCWGFQVLRGEEPEMVPVYFIIEEQCWYCYKYGFGIFVDEDDNVIIRGCKEPKYCRGSRISSEGEDPLWEQGWKEAWDVVAAVVGDERAEKIRKETVYASCVWCEGE